MYVPLWLKNMYIPQSGPNKKRVFH